MGFSSNMRRISSDFRQKPQKMQLLTKQLCRGAAARRLRAGSGENGKLPNKSFIPFVNREK